MDYFENLVKTLLEEEYNWVSQSVKVDVTKEEKRQIGKHSIPRPEIDLMAFDYRNNKVIAIEAKSLLDSPGVNYKDLYKKYDIPEGRYKLFTCQNYRNIVLKRLRLQLLSSGFIGETTQIILGLVAGNIYKNEADKIAAHFSKNGWIFWGPSEVKARVEALAAKRYENNPYIMTAKVLMR